MLDLRVLLERSQLPLKWERVVEVVHRDWTFKPAVSKHRAAAERLKKLPDKFDVFKPYIARPSHSQKPHTGYCTSKRLCTLLPDPSPPLIS